LKGRWPKWGESLSSAARSDWKDFLRSYDYKTASLGLRAYVLDKDPAYRPSIKDMKRFCRQKKSRIRGEYVECWALNEDTGKEITCKVLASTNEGAQEMFCRYLIEHGYNPVDYTLYIGVENFQAFFGRRHELECERNPKIAENVRRIRESMAVGGSLATAIEELATEYPDFDPNIDDGIPF